MTDAPRCPRCRVPVEPFALDARTTLDLCPRCNGAWFDRGELALAVAAPRDLIDPPDELPAAPPDAPLCPRCPGVCLVPIAYVCEQGAPVVEHCPYCEGNFAPLASLPAMRALAARRRVGRPRTESSSPERTPVPERAYDPDAPPDAPLTLRQCLLAVPVSFAVVATVRATGVGTFLLHGVRVSLHELGHALVAWACGWMSVPTPFGVTMTYPGRSLAVHLAVLAGCAAGAWLSARHRAWALASVCAGYALAALAFTWAVPERSQYAALSFGGCAGELVLGALLVMLAHADMPPRMRWGRWRWVALSLGACSFVAAALFWREAARDWELIPWDAALADTGDMTKLRDGHGWTEGKITRSYTVLSGLCLAGVLAAQGAAVWRAWSARRAREVSQTG